MKELANDLTARGIRTNSGNAISINVIERMLRNRKYIGEYKFRGILIENAIPPIISVELFEEVQKRNQKNRRAPARHKAEDDYLLTTKLYCGHCGAFMVGECGTSHSGKVYHYYRCTNSKRKKSCKKKTVQKEWIENLVIDQTMNMIMNDAIMEELVDKLFEFQQKGSTLLPVLQKQLAEIEKGINNMLNAIQLGIITESTRCRLIELEERKRDLEISIIQEELQNPLLTREQITFFLYRFRKFDITQKEQRQCLIDSFVNAIYLYDDKMILTFNYKDGSKTIDLKEIEGSDLSASSAE